MKYNVYQWVGIAGRLEKVGEVDEFSETAAINSAHARWKGTILARPGDDPLATAHPIGWPPSGAPMTDAELAEITAEAGRQRVQLDASVGSVQSDTPRLPEK